MALKVYELGSRTAHYDPSLGRGILVATGTELSAGHRLAFERWGAPGLQDGVWCRNRTCLRVPGGLWAPDPLHPTAGGPSYRLVPLSEQEASVFDAINDSRTGARLLEVTGASTSTLRSVATKVLAFDVQGVQIRTSRPSPRDLSLRRQLARTRPPNERTADQHDPLGRTSLTAYHEASITDGSTHFDDRETTFAHAFGLPHPAMHGLRYGARLRQVLSERGWPTAGPVVELGCGTGELAVGWGAPEQGRYRRFDLSPELLRTQDAAAPWSDGVQADLTSLPLPDDSVPLVLCNEVLADLSAVAVAEEDPETRALRTTLGLPALTHGFYNPGAWRAVIEAARILSPGGRAVYTEFGVLSGAVEEAVQLDHPEVGIHFGHLLAVAERVGLDAEVVRLDDLLQPHPDGRWLARHSWFGVRSWAFAQGMHLSARAWTPDRLQAALPSLMDGMDWVALSEDGPGPLVTRFYALLLSARSGD